MKPLCAIALCVLAGCASAQAAVRPGESAAIHAHVLAMQAAAPAPVVTPDSLRCNGTKKITNGDGHVTDCPGCVDCRNKLSLIESTETPLIQPAVFERVTKVVKQQCADGSCAAPATISSTPTKRSSGSCASGSCGTATDAGPVRRVIKAKPVRRFLGRLFRRR